MPRYLTPLDVRLYGPGRWILLAPFSFESDVLGRVLTVPKDFVTDFASVPRLPVAYLVAGNRFPGPATLHDYLYQHPEWKDRSGADSVLYEACGVSAPEFGIFAEPGWVKTLAWMGVRVGGWAAWRGDRDQNLNPVWSMEGGWPEGP